MKLPAWLLIRRTAVDTRYRYDAFISYAHEDEATVSLLERILTKTWVPGRKRPAIFRDASRLRAGNLDRELTDALGTSRFLIVCCSPHACGSAWVNEEIETFAQAHSASGVQNILACAVGSNAGDQLDLPPALKRIGGDGLFLPDLRTSSDSRPRTREMRLQAYALLAPLLDLPDKDAVFARVQKRRVAIAASTALILALVSAVALWSRTDHYQLWMLRATLEREVGARDSDQWVSTLAGLGEFDRALAAAQAIAATPRVFAGDAQTSAARAYCRVIEAAVRLNRPDVVRLAAREVTRLMSMPTEKVDWSDEALRVARGLADAGEFEAAASAAEALGIEDRSETYRALFAAAQGRGRSDLADRFIARGARSGDDDERLHWIEELFRSNRPDQARAIARQVLAAVHGKLRAHAPLGASTEVVHDIEDERGDAAETLEELVEKLVQVREFDLALTAIPQIVDPAARLAALVHVTTKRRSPTDIPLLRHILEEASAIGHQQSRDRVIWLARMEMAHRGSLADARAMLDEAEEGEGRASTAAEVSVALAQSGHIQDARTIIRTIPAEVRRVTDADDRAELIDRCVKILVYGPFLPEALALARSAPLTSLGSSARGFVAVAALRAGQTELAGRLIVEIASDAESLQSIEYRSKYLALAATLSAMSGDRDGACRYLERSSDWARQEVDDGDQDDAWMEIAAVGADAGCLRIARLAARSCNADSRRLATSIEVLERHAIRLHAGLKGILTPTESWSEELIQQVTNDVKIAPQTITRQIR